MRLLEVVPDDLVELSTPTVEPIRDPLVEVGTAFLRDPVVRRVSDQHVPEPERVVDRLVRPDQLLANEAEEDGARWAAPVRRELGKQIPLEFEPDDRCALEHVPLLRRQRLQARGEQGLNRRRDSSGLGALGEGRDQLLDEERIALCYGKDP